MTADALHEKIGGKDSEGDIDQLFLNAVSLRFLLIDEVGAISPALLGALDTFLRRACLRHPFAKRGQHQRPFGGVNIIFCGDFWQLPPVKASSIFSNSCHTSGSTRSCYTFQEQQILKMFWNSGWRPRSYSEALRFNRADEI